MMVLSFPRMTADSVLNRFHFGTAALTALFLAALLSGALANPAGAQSVSHLTRPPLGPTGGMPSAEEQRLALDRDRLEFEKQKFAVETKRENDEFQKEKIQQYWSEASTMVPVIAALLTLVYGIWSFRETAKLQFFIKAAEIAFAGKTPEAVENRAKLLKKIFGKRLPNDFPPTIEAGEHGGGKEPPEMKIAFVEMLLKYPEQGQKILSLWTTLFGDSWLEKVEPVLTGNSGNEPNATKHKRPAVG